MGLLYEDKSGKGFGRPVDRHIMRINYTTDLKKRIPLSIDATLEEASITKQASITVQNLAIPGLQSPGLDF